MALSHTDFEARDCGEIRVSHAAIAAVLARGELSTGERLVAWSLASFANREQLAWPGISAAAARAGLGRSRYLEAREQLVRHGLLCVEEPGVGRGHASAIRLLFAHSGPWWQAEVNVELLEAVLAYSRQRGPARLLVAGLAALSDGDGVVEGFTTDELCRAAGLANSTYRRARSALLASGEVEVDSANGGRGRTCRWTVRHPAEVGAEPRVEPRRRTPPPRSRPLLAAARGRTAATENGPVLSGVSHVKGQILSGVSGAKRPVLSGVSGANPATIPPETPPPNARTGREPQNPGTSHPPSPPSGGSADRWLVVEESYISDRGRRRQRSVPVDVDEVRRQLRAPSSRDEDAWRQMRDLLERRVGEDPFAIWLEPIELIAVDIDEHLVLAAPSATAAWTSARFGRLLTASALELGRDVRFASEIERHTFDACAPDTHVPNDPKEAAG